MRPAGRLLVAAVAAGAALGPVPAGAQASARIMASWTDDTAWGAHLGYERRWTIGEEGGPTLTPGVADVPSWMVSAMIAGGLVDAHDDGLEPSVYGHAGLLRRLGGARLGVGAATLPIQEAVGPAVLGEVGDVAMVHLGWMFASGDAGGFHAGLNLQLAFLTRVAFGRDP